MCEASKARICAECEELCRKRGENTSVKENDCNKTCDLCKRRWAGKEKEETKGVSSATGEKEK